MEHYFWNCYRAVGFGNLTVPGEVLVKLFSNTILFFFQESVTTATWFPPPSSVTARWEAYSTLNPYYICRCWNLGRCLPFERDTIANMHIFAYVWSYLFRIVHVFWIARVCVDGFRFAWSASIRDTFSIASLLFSEYIISLPGRVFGEQRGGAAEICLG